MTFLSITGVATVVLLSAGSVSARTPQDVSRGQAPKLVVTPALKAAVGRLDFGLREAKKTLPAGQWRVVTPRPQPATPFSPALLSVAPAEPMDCRMVKSHRDDLFPAMKVITPRPDVKHHLQIITVPPCPGR